MNIRHTLLFLSFAFLISCGKDDDSGPEKLVSTAKLRGEWECESREFKLYNDTSTPVNGALEIYRAGGPVLSFSGNGVAAEGDSYKGNFTADASGTFSLKGNTVVINIENSSILSTGTFTIDTLTSKKLTMIDTIYYSNGQSVSFQVLRIRAKR